MQGFKFFTSHILFLKKLLEDVLQQNEGVNQEREKAERATETGDITGNKS